MEPKKGKCPRCGARLDWSAPKAPPRGATPRSVNRTTLLWIGIGVLVVLGAAWHIWFGGATSEKYSYDDATSGKKSSASGATDCEALSAKLLGGKTVSAADLETFKSKCVARDRK